MEALESLHIESSAKNEIGEFIKEERISGDEIDVNEFRYGYVLPHEAKSSPNSACEFNKYSPVSIKEEPDNYDDKEHYENITLFRSSQSSKDLPFGLSEEDCEEPKEENLKLNMELSQLEQMPTDINKNEHMMSSSDSEVSQESPNLKTNEMGTSSEPIKFHVNIAAIQSISKENQASELQNLEGLSVYDQSTLEAGIKLQVDQALDLEAPGQTDAASGLETEENETEMERQIRLGEMTPFGTSLNKSLTSEVVKPIDGLSIIEQYLNKQLELQGKRRTKADKTKKLSSLTVQAQVNAGAKKIHNLTPKKKIGNDSSNRKKKKYQKVCLSTDKAESDDLLVRSKYIAGKRENMQTYNKSGSEYEPSDSEYFPSSEEERNSKKTNLKKIKPTANKRKRTLSMAKPYKIPEDWASDDSDWEYSDEEGNFKKLKKSKKELDDGDVDTYNCRIRNWRREMRITEDTQQCHQLDDAFKVPLDIWIKLYNYQRVGVQWLRELEGQRCGGVLGDEMGLGKTIQVIAFLAGLHVSQLKDMETKYRGLGPTLIVCPTTVMHQWVREFHQWYPPLRVAILHESGTFSGKLRSKLISNMVQAGGVLITSYTGVTQHKEEIVTRRWHYVVLDEGHKIRNPDAQVTLVVKQLQTHHRIILSGSPMQNNLKELWSLFDFVYPGKLGTLPVFLEQFAVPITQGGYANASKVQVMTAFKCATVLKDTIAPYLLRRMKTDVKSHIQLPEKNEQVLFCRLTDEQRHYYKGYVESGEVSGILEGRLKIFMGLINLRKICNHPDLYSGGPDSSMGEKEEERYGHWTKSGKMIVVETLLKLWQKQSHRVLLFTQSRQMLSIMESFVKEAGYKYLKLDGTTSIAARQPLINKFNQDTSYFVMLLTTRVGGLGVNLTGANRVLIYDPDWNPATDTQARERAWRIGQRQSVTVYRLITAGTIEEKMYHRQIFKQFLCNKVLKDPKQRRFFKSNDLFELFTLKETDVEGSTETGAIFAGTGSEVKLDPTKKYKYRRSEDPKITAEPPPSTFSRKKAEKKKKMEEKLRENMNSPHPENGNGNLSKEKIERMKKLAQLLSQKVVEKISPKKLVECNHITTANENVPMETDCGTTVVNSSSESTNSQTLLEIDPQVNSNKSNSSKSCSSTAQNTDTNFESTSPVTNGKQQRHKKKHKEKKAKKQKDAKFEGETVPHLVKTGSSTSNCEEKNTIDNEKYATQDEYVLQKLFARSGLQTALKHDTIMEGGPADYVLVEGEADRVAQQAIEKLQESRRECWRASSGVPNFTGLNGARNFLSKGFGKKKSVVGEMSSSSLVEAIRNRNCNRLAKDSELELVRDIRDFVSSQGGTVHTSQLINRFEGRLPEGSSPLFKSLLGKICVFYRGPDKIGYWTLREDFNW